MDNDTVKALESVGVASNVIAGHAAEMSGAAVEAAGKTVRCPAARKAGQAIQAAGKAWASKAVEVGRRDSARLRE